VTELVTVATFGEVLQAQMCRAKLGAGGVRAFVADEHTSTLNPHYLGAASGIRVQVRRVDVPRALEILKVAANESEDEGDDAGDEDPELDDGPRCPRCEARYSYFEWSPGQVLLIVLMLGLPLLFLRKTWHCRRCDHRFLPAPLGDRRESPYRKPRRGSQARPGS
jgi:rubredoxin